MLPSAPSLVHPEVGQEGVQPESKGRGELLSFQHASKVVGAGEGPVKKKKRRKRSSAHSFGRDADSDEQGDLVEQPKRSPTSPTGVGTLSSHPALHQGVGVGRGVASPCSEQVDPQVTLSPSAVTQGGEEDREKAPVEERLSTAQQAKAATVEQETTKTPPPHETATAETPASSVPIALVAPGTEQGFEPEAVSRPTASIHTHKQNAADLAPESTAEGPASLLGPEQQNMPQPSPCKAAGEPVQPEGEPVAASYLSSVDPSASISAQLAQQTLVPLASAEETGAQQGLGTPGQGSSSSDVEEVAERTLAPLPDVPSERGTPQSLRPLEEEVEHPPLPPPPSAGVIHEGGLRRREELQTDSAVSVSQQSGSAVSVVSADDEAPAESLVQPTSSKPLEARDHPPVRRPLTQKVVSMPMAPRNLPPVQPMNMTHLPPARNRLAPIHHVTTRDPPPSTVSIYRAHTELSDSLSSLGSESEDEMTHSGAQHDFCVYTHTHTHSHTHTHTHAQHTHNTHTHAQHTHHYTVTTTDVSHYICKQCTYVTIVASLLTSLSCGAPLSSSLGDVCECFLLI